MRFGLRKMQYPLVLFLSQGRKPNLHQYMFGVPKKWTIGCEGQTKRCLSGSVGFVSQPSNGHRLFVPEALLTTKEMSGLISYILTCIDNT